MRIRLSVVAVFSVVVAWSAVCAAAEPSISNLPAAVQERIREKKGQGEVKKIKTRRQADRRNVYEIEYKEGGDEKMVVLGQDGSVISETAGKEEAKGKGKGPDKEKKEKKEIDNKGQNKKRERNAEKADKDDNKAVQEEARPVVRQPEPAAPRTEPVATRPEAVIIRPETPTRPATTTTNRPTLNRRTATTAGSQTGSAGGAAALDRRPGQFRYIYFDTMPEAVRTAANAQQAQHGPINNKALFVQKKPGSVLYHVSYQRSSLIFTPDGKVSVVASNTGGPAREVKWDDLPSGIRNAAIAAKPAEGDVKTSYVTFQSSAGKALYHVQYDSENVLSFSADGSRQDAASYWR